MSTSVTVRDPAIAQEMLRLRLGQMIINEHYKKGDFKIPIHLAIGHEAIAVAACHVTGPDDRLVLPHRNMHYNLARCGRLKPVLDEFFLRPTGLAAAKLGSMNLANPDQGIAYSSSILGNALGVAAGIAYGQQKMRGIKGIVTVVTGDGGIEEGTFSEMLTFMTTYGLSALVIVENNGWSLATHISERRCDIKIERLADAFCLEYRSLESNDVFDYISTLRECRQAAIDAQRPVVIEVALHSLGDRRMAAEGYPEGKYINYHAGPAPTVSVNPWPLVREDRKDPIFVLQDHFEAGELRGIAARTLQELELEIR